MKTGEAVREQGDVEEQCMGRCGGAVGKMWRSMEKQEQQEYRNEE